MQKVQILGTGCNKCHRLYDNARQAASGRPSHPGKQTAQRSRRLADDHEQFLEAGTTLDREFRLRVGSPSRTAASRSRPLRLFGSRRAGDLQEGPEGV